MENRLGEVVHAAQVINQGAVILDGAGVRRVVSVAHTELRARFHGKNLISIFAESPREYVAPTAFIEQNQPACRGGLFPRTLSLRSLPCGT